LRKCMKTKDFKSFVLIQIQICIILKDLFPSWAPLKCKNAPTHWGVWLGVTQPQHRANITTSYPARQVRKGRKRELPFDSMSALIDDSSKAERSVAASAVADGLPVPRSERRF